MQLLKEKQILDTKILKIHIFGKLKIIKMKKLFVPFEIGLILKNKGFKEPCLAYYDENNHELRSHSVYPLDMCNYNSEPEQEYAQEPISAPLYQQVKEWLDNHFAEYWTIPVITGNPKEYECFIWHRGSILNIGKFGSQKEAENTAILELLKRISWTI